MYQALHERMLDGGRLSWFEEYVDSWQVRGAGSRPTMPG